MKLMLEAVFLSLQSIHTYASVGSSQQEAKAWCEVQLIISWNYKNLT